MLFDNIIEHSGLKANELRIEVNIKNSEDSISFEIRNNFSTSLNKETLENTLQNVKRQWQFIDDSMVNKEGGSGFEKIKKIIKYQIIAFNNSFDFKIEQNELSIILIFEVLRNERN